MEKKFSLRPFQLSMKILFLIPYLLVSTFGYTQQTKINTLEIDDIQAAYVDRPGDLYIKQKDKIIKKFDVQGKLLNTFRFDNPPGTFDPRDGARMFVYFTKTQRCEFFSQETKQEFVIEQHYAIEPTLTCSSGDHQLWISDRSDWSVKRINPNQSKVVAEGLIDQKQFSILPQFTFMREYQNFLFLIEKNTGILVFNSLGIQIKKIDAPEIEYINFLGEELYYKKNDKLIFYDLFDATTREQSVDPACHFALLTDTRIFLTYSNRVEIFENH
jgi:competence protein ComGF